MILQDGNESLEIDLLVVNTDEVVLVEVKTKLSQSDVDEHLERIAKLRRLAHQYRGTKLLGAVAGIIVPPEVARYAYRQGLFVLARSFSPARGKAREFSSEVWERSPPRV